jgi:hypothetical protein
MGTSSAIVLTRSHVENNNDFEKFLRKAMEFALTVPLGGLITPVARHCVRRSFSLPI